jgi:PAS domain S-box-containing protein
VLIFLTVSALVLWHEQRVLTAELEVQGDLLARLLALSASDGGAPEYLAIFSLTDLRAGEVRSSDGEIMWRYGPPFDEVEALGGSILRVERRVELATGPWGRNPAVEVTLLLSRDRVQQTLAGAAVRLVIALAFALAIAMIVGLWIVDRVARPLNELADLTRSFDPGEPLAMADAGPGTAELAELAAAFREMTRRLSEQQRSLAASEERYRGLFSSSPTPLFELDGKLCIRDANPAAVAFLGVEPQEASGRPLEDYVVGRADGDHWSGLSRTLAEHGEGVVEGRWRLPGGELAEIEIHLRSSGAGESAGSIAAIHDLTDRVRRLGQRWQRTFDAMIDGVALVDDRGRVELANRALAPHLPVLSHELAERGANEGSWRIESLGRLLECNFSQPDDLRHAILVVRDVTEAVGAEARLREIEKMQAVATLASGVAHDFNNLLAAVQLHLRLIEAEPERAAEAVEAIRDLSEQGSEVVGELLLFASTHESLPPEAFDLSVLVTGQEGVLNHLLPDGVALRIDAVDGPIPVSGNPVALRRLILNLVVNARDVLAPDGGVITIAVSRRGGRAVLEVADTGPGVPEEYRDRLFEPFFTLSRKGRGAGLGLAVVYAIAQAHGGEVELASPPGEGARFVVRLPPGNPAELDDLGARAEASPDEEPPRVVLVDADGRSAADLLEGLAEAGFDVRHAPSPAEAERLAATWSPDAVVVRAENDGTVDGLEGVDAPLIVIDDGSPASTADVVARLEAVLA